MKTTKMKFAGVLMFFLGLGMFSQITAQTTDWIFNDGNGKYSNWKIVEHEHEISKVYCVGGTVSSPTWSPCTIEKLDDQYTYTYIRVKNVNSSGKSTIYELNLYWADEKLTRVKPDGSTNNFWLKK
jgi:hypothetical protein